MLLRNKHNHYKLSLLIYYIIICIYYIMIFFKIS